ncbi:hypothetical protein C496_02517 [Natronorubrum tibetense GA33]|uniref:Sulfatase N-terminal domain-containing protein n=2 Tax=Natronorubrum tibetense TaxID=63128 RepID=L9W8H0_9EURY|nr:hypothetical protein C496_02517 [Natronorubrum tibetense GA33]
MLKTISEIHSSLISSQYPQQEDLLGKLRSEDNYCLIVLDACRFDYLQSSFHQYFQGECMPTWAASLNTFQYLQNLWKGTYDFPYITAAAPVTSQKFNFQDGEKVDGLAGDGAELSKRYNGYIPNEHFNQLVEVWREAWDEDLGVCPPEPVTERAIDIAPETDQMVVHYFQPHGPFIGSKQLTGQIEEYDTNIKGGAVEKGIWSAAKSGDLNKSDLRKMYQANLDRVLPAVGELVQRTDFDKYIVIGDHGEALGEYNRYYHSIEHPKVRLVPWAQIDGVQENIPEMWEYEAEAQSIDKDTVSRLQELGYIE